MTTVGTRTPRLVYAPALHLRRSLDVANDACVGRFTAAGVTVAAGWPPRWDAVDQHPDREWWIEWIKFYYGLDLAHAAAITGDRRYVLTWQRLVRSWIDTAPLTLGPTDAMGRRLQNWVYAWTAFAAAPAGAGFESGFEEALLASLDAQATYLQANLAPERNHRTLELYALFVVALALPETDPGSRRLDFAWHALHENLIADVRPDGVHREQSTHYHMIALRSFLAARENARRFGLPVPPDYDARLARAVDFAMACHRPDGSIPALSDSDTDDYRDCLALAADLLDRDDARFVATDGREGIAPDAPLAEFPHGGYCVQRTPWPHLRLPLRAQRHLVFDCGPLGDGGHGHYDLLSVDAWAGRPVLVDPGRYTYASGTPDWRRWFKGTAAHNTVTVDGRDQTAYRSGKPKTPPASGRRTTSLASPRLDLVGAEARSAEYDAVHERHVFFVDHDYWVIVDELRGDGPHDYDLRFHLAPDTWRRVAVAGQRVQAPGVLLLGDGPGAWTLDDGWVSPTYGVKHEAPVVSRCARGGRAARFVTAVLPWTDTDAAAATLAVSGPDEAALTVTIDAPARGITDRLTWQRGGVAIPVRDRDIVAEAAWIRTAAGGRVVACAAVGVRPDGTSGAEPGDIWILDESPIGLRVGRGRTA